MTFVIMSHNTPSHPVQDPKGPVLQPTPPFVLLTASFSMLSEVDLLAVSSRLPQLIEAIAFEESILHVGASASNRFAATRRGR